MATIDVKDAAGTTVPIEKPLAPGRTSAALSRPVVLATEDKDALDAILAKIIATPATSALQTTGNTSLGSIDTKLTTVIGHVDGLETLIGATNTALAGNQIAVGNVASGAADSGNPVKVGGKYVASSPILTDGQRSDLLQTAEGDLRVSLHHSGASLAGIAGVYIQGFTAHDDVVLPRPVLVGGYASAAAPANVSADGDAVRLWSLRNGALVTNLSAAGALISGDAPNGLDVDVTRLPALVAGAAIIGQVGIDQTTPGTTNKVSIGTDGRAAADASAATGGIASTSRIVSAAATTNATSAKGSAGRLYAIQGYNAATSVRYLKLYNKATAPTVGTDTPVKTLALPPGAGFAFDWPVGYSFATGIGYGLTTGSADSDTSALTAGDVLGLNIDYV
jgi:hypothetical protein